ncbi:MAG: hypothetical protein KC646_01750 [Candidatus Cloacimonetes bacterium]|nr:hypothetical protein [Candidatus Cloacimonadota bacterium]
MNNKYYWNQLKLFISIFLCLTLVGCGGFSEEAGSSTSTPANIFLQGTVNFPNTLPSKSKISSISKSISSSLVGNPVGKGRVYLHKASDIFFQDSILKSGTVIITNSDGSFSITDDQIRDGVFTNSKESLLVRVVFDNKELTSFTQLKQGQTSIGDKIGVNLLSDSAFRFVKEEISAKIGGVNDQGSPTYSKITQEMNLLLDDLSENAIKIQNEFTFNASDFQESNYIVDSIPTNGSSGSSFSRELKNLALTSKTWKESFSLSDNLKSKVFVESSLPLSSGSQLKRRKLQLLYTFLNAGYYVSDGLGNFFVKDRWQKVYQGNAPTIKSYISSNDLIAFFDVSLTTSDLTLLPPPNHILRLNLTELNNYANAGTISKEKTLRISRDANSFPWVSVSTIGALSEKNTQYFVSLNNVIDNVSNVLSQKRYSIERVQKTLASEGLILFGQDQLVSAQYSKTTTLATDMKTYWSSKKFTDTTLVEFEKLVKEPQNYFSQIKKIFQAEYGRLSKTNFSIVNLNNGYPDPLSEIASENFIFRNISNQRVVNNNWIESDIEILESNFAVLYRLKNMSNQLTMSSKISLREVIQFIPLLFKQSYSLDKDIGYFKDISSPIVAKVPRLENVKLLNFEPIKMDSLWSSMIASSSIISNFTTDTAINTIAQGLSTLSTSSLVEYEIPKTNAVKVNVKGRIFKGLGASKTPAAYYSVFAEDSNGARHFAQTDASGYYSFFSDQLVGDQTYSFGVELRNHLLSSTSSASIVTAAFDYYILGFESETILPDFSLSEEYIKAVPQSSGQLDQIQILNSAPMVSFTPQSNGTLQGIVPVSVKISDQESNSANLRFSFTLGQNLLTLPSDPKISLSSSANTTFLSSGIIPSLSSSNNGVITTFYWHTDKEILDADTTGLGDQEDIRITVKVSESANTSIVGNEIVTYFALMDNTSPSLDITYPLDDGNALGLNKLTVLGKSVDLSGVTSIWVSNVSLKDQAITSIYAKNTGISFNTFEIIDVPVEQGIKNKLEFYAIDVLGNINKTAIVREFLSLDVIPPSITLSQLNVRGVATQPTLTSGDPLKPINFSSNVSNQNGLYSDYTFNLNQSPSSVQLGFVTSKSISLSASASDVNNVKFVRTGISVDQVFTETKTFNFEKTVGLSEGNNIDLVITATDDKNNDSGTTDLTQKFKTLSAVHIKIATVDFSPPEVAITNLPEGSLEQLVTTNIVEIKGAATDLSKITTLSLCSTIACSIVTSNFLDWTVKLPISEGVSNFVTGYISDQHGFVKRFTNSSFFTKLNLNDITKPRAVIQSASGFNLTSLPYLISETRSSYNSSVFDTNCATSSCIGHISGYIEDESGFKLSRGSTSTDTRTFDNFSFRFGDLSLFSPQSDDINKLLGKDITFSTKTNFVRLTTSSAGVSSRVSFQGEIVLNQDGIWPLKLDLIDNASDKFEERGYTSKALKQYGTLYFRRDKTAPVIKVDAITQVTDNTSGKYKVSGTVEDELSPVTAISVNGTAISTTTFSTKTSSSPWSKFTTLSPLVSVGFSAELTLPSGKGLTINIIANDVHGNASTLTTNVDVFPLFTKTITRGDLFKEPIQVGFGGTNLDTVFVADKSALQVREFSVGGDPRTTIVGNKNSSSVFFGQIERLDSFDMVYDRTKNLGSFLMSGKYSGRTLTTTQGEIAHFPKTENSEQNQINRPALIGKFVLESNVLKGSDNHIFRENDASESANNFLTNAVVRYAPKLGSVVYVAAQTSSGLDLYLRRYVKSFAKNVDPLTNQVYVQASEGGFAKSTGTAADFPSAVSSIAITQVHTLNSLLPGGISQSVEYSYLTLPNEKSIVRYRFVNSAFEASAKFTKLTSWTFPLIKPSQVEVDQDGKSVYISDQNTLRVYKFSVTSADTLTAVTDFGGVGYIGGIGYKDQNFRSINGIRGIRPLNSNNFSNLYITDAVSKRISVFTSAGTFVNYFADNPYGLGGIQAPALLSEYKNDEWLMLDTNFDTFDVYNTSDTAYSRVSAASLGLVSYTTQIQELIYSDERVNENTTNLLNSAYFTNSLETYKTTSSSLYFIEEQDNKLYVVNDLQSVGFTAILTSVIQGENAICTSVVPSVAWTDACTTLPEYVPNVVPNQRVVSQKTTFTRNPRSFLGARDNFGQNGYKLKAIDLVQDSGVQRLMILESGGTEDRVQMFSESEIHLSSTHTGQTSGVGICDMGTYLVVAGNSPANSFSVATYPAGTKKIQNDIFFSSYPIYDLDGTSVHTMTNVKDMHCSNDKIAIADSTGVKIFAAPTNPSAGFPMLQFINTTDDSLTSSDPMRKLSGSIDVLMRKSNLFVLEKERKRVHKYQIK